MKPASFQTAELGNLLFGHSRGNFHIERDQWENAFSQFLTDNGFDAYGYHPTQQGGYENDTFIIRPYYWGDDEDIMALPNFVYKPTGFTISWYKYPLRDAYASADISNDDFTSMLAACAASMR